MITTKRRTIISPRRVQSASSVRIPQNIGRSLLPTINITPLKLSSVSSIKLNGASNCNILRNRLRIRLSPVKSPIIRKYKNPDKRHSLHLSISSCNVKSCISCSHLNCKSTIRSTVNGRQFSIVYTTDLDWRFKEVIYVLTCCEKGCGMQYVGQT